MSESLSEPTPEPQPVSLELPMFPLGLVLFPGQLLPMRIFEQRYLDMLEVCLDSHRSFGVVLIERGSEVGGGDLRSNLGTLAELELVRPLEGGQKAVIVHGTRRFKVLEWLEDDPYPRATVEFWPCEEEPAGSAGELGELFDDLDAMVRRIWALRREMGAKENEPPDDYDHDSDGSFLLASRIPLQQFDRQKLLAAPGVSARLRLLAQLLEDHEELLLANLNSAE